MRLRVHGGMQKWGINYWDNYAPVVNCISVLTLLAITKIRNLKLHSIGFVLEFPQAKLYVNMYMELPIGIDPPDRGKRDYVLKLNKDLYGINQASENWFETLKAGLNSRAFEQSYVDPCVFLRKDALFLVCVDDCIIVSKYSQIIEDLVDFFKNGPKNFILTHEGGIENYLGVEIKPLEGDTFELCQPYLIKKFLDLSYLPNSVKGYSRPANKKLLSRDENGPPQKHSWQYRSAVGMLSYLQGSTRPAISMALHQCTRFSNDPRLVHERAVRKIGKYLSETAMRGIIYDPDKTQGIEYYVDADFAGGWDRDDGQRTKMFLI